MTELPIIYLATDKATALKVSPPEVLAECREVNCSCCKTPVMAVEETLSGMANLSQRTNRPLVVVCQPCFDRITEDQQEVVVLHHRRPDLHSLLAKYMAEKN